MFGFLGAGPTGVRREQLDYLDNLVSKIESGLRRTPDLRDEILYDSTTYLMYVQNVRKKIAQMRSGSIPVSYSPEEYATLERIYWKIKTWKPEYVPTPTFEISKPIRTSPAGSSFKLPSVLSTTPPPIRSAEPGAVVLPPYITSSEPSKSVSPSIFQRPSSQIDDSEQLAVQIPAEGNPEKPGPGKEPTTLDTGEIWAMVGQIAEGYSNYEKSKLAGRYAAQQAGGAPLYLTPGQQKIVAEEAKKQIPWGWIVLGAVLVTGVLAVTVVPVRKQKAPVLKALPSPA